MRCRTELVRSQLPPQPAEEKPTPVLDVIDDVFEMAFGRRRGLFWIAGEDDRVGAQELRTEFLLPRVERREFPMAPSEEARDPGIAFPPGIARVVLDHSALRFFAPVRSALVSGGHGPTQSIVGEREVVGC